MLWRRVVLAAATMFAMASSAARPLSDEAAAMLFLKQTEAPMSRQCTQINRAEWNFQTNISDYNSNQQVQVQIEAAQFQKQLWKTVTSLFDWTKLPEGDTKRQIKGYSVLGLPALSDDEYQQFTQTVADMQGTYGKAKVCAFDQPDKCDLNLDPDVTEIMATSRNFAKLQHTWKEWHEKSGRPMRKAFEDYVRLGNLGAVANKFGDRGEMWRDAYETPTFQSDLEHLWDQLKPLYQQLHAYVRRRLRLYYGNDRVSKDGPIPAHILGNIWAQDWGHVLDITIPYPDKVFVDVTPEMISQGYTAEKMFHLSDEFFTSVGLEAMPPSFWNKTQYVRPQDREVVCHASAWDFCDGKDFRVKMCTEVTMNDLITVHHEMGHIQYFLQYKDLPYLFRQGANPGFHEAVGDVLALSVSTPAHLHQIGLLPLVDDDEKGDINFLYGMALDKLAFVPFGYVIDLWRWQVFNGKIGANEYNAKWWQLRRQYQGVVPPVERSELDFDPGAKYHVAADVPYIRYFVSFVIQFQFHKSVCEEAGQYVPGDDSKPLHKCDIFRNKAAGKVLRDTLRLGASKPWPEAMKVATRGATDKMDASALVEYFRPLLEFLKKDNEKFGEYIGWK